MPDLERFIITRVGAGVTVSRPFYVVEDDLTGRVREVTHDEGEAQAIAAHLNAGRVYDTADDLVLQPA